MTKKLAFALAFSSLFLCASAHAQSAPAPAPMAPPPSQPNPFSPQPQSFGPLGIGGIVLAGVGAAGVAVGGLMTIYELAVEPCDHPEQCRGDRTIFLAGLTTAGIGLGAFLIPGIIMVAVDQNQPGATTPRPAAIPEVRLGATSAELTWRF